MMTVKAVCSIGSLGLMAGLVIGSGCWSRADSHCGNLQGPATCGDREAGSFCNICVAFNDGCTDQVPPEGCNFIEDGSGTSGAEGNGTTGTANEGGSIGGTTAGVMSLDGEVSAEATTLEASDDGDMATDTGGEPPCGSNDPCSGATPICDAMTGACVECTEHVHCGVDVACNFFTGACLSARVVHVGPVQSYVRLEDAVASFTMETALEGTIIVHAGFGYWDTVVVDGGRTIAFLPPHGDLPIWSNDEYGTSQLTVSGTGTSALLDGVVLTHGPSQMPGLRVKDSARVWVDRTRIVENGGGVVVESSAEVVLRNCFINNDSNDLNVVELNKAKATILYSTLGARGDNATALLCSEPMSLVVRNSIIVARDSAIDLDCGITSGIAHTATGTSDLGMDNQSVGTPDGTGDDRWFDDYNEGRFRLRTHGSAIFANIAQWQVGDPRIDIDGDPRPHIDGTPDHAGADRP